MDWSPASGLATTSRWPAPQTVCIVLAVREYRKAFFSASSGCKSVRAPALPVTGMRLALSGRHDGVSSSSTLEIFA